VNADLGAGLDLTAVVQTRINLSLVFILVLGIWVEVRFGFTSGLGLSLSIGPSLVLCMKGRADDKKNNNLFSWGLG
jgi:hypothetical protein